MNEEQEGALRAALTRGRRYPQSGRAAWWHQVRNLSTQEFQPSGTLHTAATKVSGEAYGTDTYLVTAYTLALDSWPDLHKRPPSGGLPLGAALAETGRRRRTGNPSNSQLSLYEHHLIQVITDRHRPEPVLHATTNAVRLCWKFGQTVDLAGTAVLLVGLWDPSDQVRHQARLRIAEEFHSIVQHGELAAG